MYKGTSREKQAVDIPKMYWGIDWNPGYDGLFDGQNVLVSAGVGWYTAWDNDEWFGYPRMPEQSNEVFVDSGGFQATARWRGNYPYTIGKYFNWATQMDADYVAGPDLACEPSLGHSSVEERVIKTVAMHREAKRVYETGDWDFQFVPVLQGFEPEHYELCSDLFQRFGLSESYMAIGTVCKRKDTDAIHETLCTLENRFPNAEWHMFGLTKYAWKDERFWGRFRSADTAAWNFGASTTEEKMQAGESYIEDIESIRDDIATEMSQPTLGCYSV